jgi:hypothetical protein
MGELGKSVLYTCMKISQRNAFVQYTYATKMNKKISVKIAQE